MMGTLIQITVNSKEAQVDIYDAIDEAFEEFHHVIEIFSRFDDTSELSRLNESGGKWFDSSKELFDLIKLSLDTAEKTDYVFDPTIIDLLWAYGYENSFSEKEIAEKIKKTRFEKEILKYLKSRPKATDIELDEQNHKIKLQPKQRIDLGASAKGYSVDLAADKLRALGFDDFLINAGGDVYAGGKKTAALFDPRNPREFLGKVEIENESICGSGSLAKKVGVFHHLINPKTGKAENKVMQTYVKAETALLADLWSTVLFLMGEDGVKLLPKGVEYLMILNSDKNDVVGDLKVMD